MYSLTNNSSAAFAGGFLGGMFTTVLIVGLIVYVLMIIAYWRIFEKAGEAGWKSLIPIYNSYIFFKIVGMTKCFWGLIIASFVISFITSYIAAANPEAATSAGVGVFCGVLSFLLSVFVIVVSILYSVRLSKAFGHGLGFTLGLIFLSGIFLLILGFDHSKYNKKVVSSFKQI